MIIVHSASIVDCCNWTLSHSKDWTSKGNNWQKNTAHVEYKQGKQPTWKSHNVQIFWLAFLPDTGSYFNILHVDSSKIGKLHELEYLLGQNGEQEMVFYKWRYKEGYWYTLEHKVLSKWKRFFFWPSKIYSPCLPEAVLSQGQTWVETADSGTGLSGSSSLSLEKQPVVCYMWYTCFSYFNYWNALLISLLFWSIPLSINSCIFALSF